MDDIRYPIGHFVHDGPISDEELHRAIDEIEALPSELRAAVEGLTEEQLDTPYRPGGWKVRQVVHHIADSHLNSYARFKWALTEDLPTIKPYDEELWAELPDYHVVPAETSLVLTAALHERLVGMLRALSREELARQYDHPELGRTALEFVVLNFSWHGRHHVAHITQLRDRMGW